MLGSGRGYGSESKLDMTFFWICLKVLGFANFFLYSNEEDTGKDCILTANSGVAIVFAIEAFCKIESKGGASG